jgi:hypothetical protein
MSRKSLFRFAWALTILLAFTLGCKIVDNVNEVVTLATDVGGLATSVNIEGVTTDIGGLVTQIDVEGLVTDIGGIATDIDLESLSTQMGSITTEMGSFMTDMPGLGGTPGPVNTPNGFPSDIPLMTGSITEMSGTPASLNYSVDAELSAVLDFYRREMTARGWSEQPGSTGDGTAELVFQKGNRRIRVKVEEGLLFNVSVTITVEA